MQSFHKMTDPALAAWAVANSQHLSETPAAFFISPQQAADYAALVAAFGEALAAWVNPATRTPVASANKRATRNALLDGARYIVSTINSNPAISAAQRDLLGIRARKRPTPIPAPDLSPVVDVDSVSGRTVTLTLHTAGRRGRPAGVQGASVFTFVGAAAPADPSAWTFEGLITRTRFSVSFEQRTGADTAWVSAFWYNERGQSGEASAPRGINLPAASAGPVAASAMKIAA